MYLPPLLTDRLVGPEPPQPAGAAVQGPAGRRMRDWRPAVHHYSPGIQLRFDQKRKNRMGFVFGKDDSCDVVLPRTESLRGIADRQCFIGFDTLGRLILRDIRDSRLETAARETTCVRYTSQLTPGRRDFTWVLSGHDFIRKQGHIRIAFHVNLYFHIVVVLHNIESPAYRRNVARFRANGETLAVPRDWAGPHQVVRVQPLLSQNSVLLWYGELGRGGQGIVSRRWDVSTGAVYASKEPIDSRNKEQADRLRTEAKLLRRINHPNIIRIKFFRKRPSPTLVLEYAACQTLAEQMQEKPLSAEETLLVLRQGLSALRCLHEREKPIVHRDINLANILVTSREPSLQIKLCDFGYSKAKRDFLATRFGTPYFTAPEVFTNELMCASMDIWSFGVVILTLCHGLPRDDCRSFSGDAYAWRIVWFLNALAESTSCPLIDYLSCHMLVIDPVARMQAFGCELFAGGLSPPRCCGRHSSQENSYAEDKASTAESSESTEPQADQQAPRDASHAGPESVAGRSNTATFSPTLAVRSAAPSPSEQSDPKSRQRGFGDRASPWTPMQALQRQQRQDDGTGKEKEN